VNREPLHDCPQQRKKGEQQTKTATRVTSDSGWIDAGGKQEDGGSCSFKGPYAPIRIQGLEAAPRRD
jgi:hypothetical protein